MSYSLNAVNQPIKILIIGRFLPADIKRYDIGNTIPSITLNTLYFVLLILYVASVIIVFKV